MNVLNVQLDAQGGVEVILPFVLVPNQALMDPPGQIYMVIMGQSLSQIVAQRVEQAILAAGYKSQDQFAQKVGLSRGTLSKVLSCTVDVRLSTLEKIAAGLGVPANLLLLPTPIPGIPATDSHTRGLRHAGRPAEPEISVKVRIPDGVTPPAWLVSLLKRASEVETTTSTQTVRKNPASPIVSARVSEKAKNA